MSFNIFEYPADHGFSAVNSELYAMNSPSIKHTCIMSYFVAHSSVPVLENGLDRNINVVLSNCRILPVILQNISSFVSDVDGQGQWKSGQLFFCPCPVGQTDNRRNPDSGQNRDRKIRTDRDRTSFLQNFGQNPDSGHTPDRFVRKIRTTRSTVFEMRSGEECDKW